MQLAPFAHVLFDPHNSVTKVKDGYNVVKSRYDIFHNLEFTFQECEA